MTESLSAVAQAARECEVAKRAEALGRWIADESRPLTSRQVLRKLDVAAAATAIGVTAPKLLRSAADVPALHRPWCLARAAGLVLVADGSAGSGAGWPVLAEDVLSAWLAGLRAAGQMEAGPKAVEYDATVGLLAVLTVLGREAVPTGHALRSAVMDQAVEVSREFDLDWSFRSIDEDRYPMVIELLRSFGAVDAALTMTPLGRWAAGELRRALPGFDAGLTAGEMLAELAGIPEAQRGKLAWKWMSRRDPERTAREILQAAASASGPASPLLRWIAADVTELLGPEVLSAWRETLHDPLMAIHGRCVEYAWDEGPELTEAERIWLTVETAAAGLADRGPDEAWCRIWERLPSDGLEDSLAVVRASGHPSADALASAVAELAASGAPLTVNQVMQLKVSLRDARPPVWRSVVVPSVTTLGDLRRIVQVLFSWDGDHMHVFRLGAVEYSNPSFNLEGTADENEIRIRDAFADGRKVSYEYDLGASWMHEITLQKTLPLDPEVGYPVCVAFAGESPEEYDDDDDFDYIDEDDDVEDEEDELPDHAEREPFTLTAVNQRLTVLAGQQDATEFAALARHSHGDPVTGDRRPAVQVAGYLRGLGDSG